MQGKTVVSLVCSNAAITSTPISLHHAKRFYFWFRAKVRAKANWQRAQKAAEKSITMNLLKGKRE